MGRRGASSPRKQPLATRKATSAGYAIGQGGWRIPDRPPTDEAPGAHLPRAGQLLKGLRNPACGPAVYAGAGGRVGVGGETLAPSRSDGATGCASSLPGSPRQPAGRCHRGLGGGSRSRRLHLERKGQGPSNAGSGALGISLLVQRSPRTTSHSEQKLPPSEVLFPATSKHTNTLSQKS